MGSVEQEGKVDELKFIFVLVDITEFAEVRVLREFLYGGLSGRFVYANTSPSILVYNQ